MFIKIIWVSLVGSIINMDEHTVVQSMICRPIIAGPIIGYLLGDLNTGLIIGILLELILLNVLPVGAAMPINFSTITVIAVSLTILISESNYIPISPSFIIFVLAWVMPLGLVYRELENLSRKLNVYLVRFAEKRILKGKLNAVEKITYIGVLVSFLKAFVFIMAILLSGIYLFPKVYLLLSGKVIEGLRTAYLLVFILGMSVVIETFSIKMGKRIEKDNSD